MEIDRCPYIYFEKRGKRNIFQKFLFVVVVDIFLKNYQSHHLALILIRGLVLSVIDLEKKWYF
jgi:hypothetical protein